MQYKYALHSILIKHKQLAVFLMQHEDLYHKRKDSTKNENLLKIYSSSVPSNIYMSLFLIRTDLEHVESHHLLTNESSALNGCRQNESQTADKNITIHTNPVHQLTS